MKLNYLSQEAIDDLKINYSRYKNHFKDEKNDWFINYFQKNKWIQESKIECADFSLNMDADYNVSDRKNVEIIYEALKDMSPSLASDERLWAGMLFSQFWDYVKYRRSDELEKNSERDVLNSFLFMRGTKRSCFLNCLSRLWWTGYLLYDDKNHNHYEKVDLICESAYASNIVLLSSNNFAANKNLVLGVLDCISMRKKQGEKIGRYHYVLANKYLNCIGGAALLDTMTRDEARDLANKQLNKIYRTIELA